MYNHIIASQSINLVLITFFRITQKSNILHYMLFMAQKLKQCKQKVAIKWLELSMSRFVLHCFPAYFL